MANMQGTQEQRYLLPSNTYLSVYFRTQKREHPPA
jgi:hypothetical protein